MSKTNATAETFSVKQMTLMALMTALICVIAPFSIPLGFKPGAEFHLQILQFTLQRM